MTSFLTPHTPTIRKNEQKIYCLKTIEFGRLQDPYYPLTCGRHKFMVPK